MKVCFRRSYGWAFRGRNSWKISDWWHKLGRTHNQVPASVSVLLRPRSGYTFCIVDHISPSSSQNGVLSFSMRSHAQYLRSTQLSCRAWGDPCEARSCTCHSFCSVIVVAIFLKKASVQSVGNLCFLTKSALNSLSAQSLPHSLWASETEKRQVEGSSTSRRWSSES